MRFRKVLVPLDGSARAEKAIAWARALARPEDVVLMQAVDMAYIVDPTWLIAASEKYLAGLAGKSQTRTHAGPAVATILNAAKEVGADLIAITTRGTARSARDPVGKTTLKLMHAGDTPLLIVPADVEVPNPVAPKRFLVPLDGSEKSESILPMVRALVPKDGEVVLHHVLDLLEAAVPFDVESATGYKALEAAIESRRREMNEYLNAQVRALKQEKIKARFIMEQGRLPDAIVERAQKEKADLVVMSAHGYGAIGRAILGSVSTSLVREGKVPVLLARGYAPKKTWKNIAEKATRQL